MMSPIDFRPPTLRLKVLLKVYKKLIICISVIVVFTLGFAWIKCFNAYHLYGQSIIVVNQFRRAKNLDHMYEKVKKEEELIQRVQKSMMHKERYKNILLKAGACIKDGTVLQRISFVNDGFIVEGTSNNIESYSDYMKRFQQTLRGVTFVENQKREIGLDRISFRIQGKYENAEGKKENK